MTVKLMIAVAVIFAPTGVAAQTSNDQPALVSSGNGHYEAWCKITPTSGEESTRYLQPGRDVLSLSKVHRAECSYKASAAGPLTLKLLGSEWVCPFTKDPAAACEVTYAASRFGNFDLRRKAK